MAVNNTLAAKKAPAAAVTEYESNGEVVKLSPQTIRNYLVSGGGAVTDQEIMMFMSLCRFQHLNPFLKEAYLIKYGNSPATIVTGKDVFTKRAKRNKDYAGKQAGIIVTDSTGAVEEREGTLVLPDETIVGGWAKVYIKGYEKPEYAAVSFNEYAGRKSNGELNSQWASKPATMIRKVALVQALREAFPEDYSGLYSPEEKPEASEIVLEDAVGTIPQQEQPTPAPTPEQPQPQPQEAKAPAQEPQEAQSDAMSALFS